MAGNSCKITLRSTQKMGGDKEVSEESYLGSFMDRGGKKYLTYRRTTEDGVIECLMAFDRKSFSMTQKGALNSKIELVPGKKTLNKYTTPLGNLSLEIFTRHYQVIEEGNNIAIGIEYDIVTGADAIQTSMEINVKNM